MDRADALIVGAGVVGLASARAIAQRGLSVLVVERHGASGQETSSRNSGVIHSGIYYPTASLKARLCVDGRGRLYDYCEQRGIAHQRCGKLIVAQAGQLDRLRALQAKARANGVHDLELLDAQQVRSLEPAVRCTAALLSPSTGIIDVHEFMQALEADLQAAEAIVAYNTELVGAAVRGTGFVASLRTSDEVIEFACRYLVNCAGLHAVELLKSIEGYRAGRELRSRFAKGSYFSCGSARPFGRLVYPMPDEAGLGVHATLDLDGSTRFGPDVEWVDALDYRVDAARAAAFYASIREYWPDLPDGALQPAYAGIRPKLVGAGERAADFLIESPRESGVPGLFNLLGIESPGLTSSLAIGELVARQLTA